ncbi:MAG: hypothetical protein MJK04_19010 [Psychrosphaera sp.]|nr:hypothetical protein [Psychrosphaera sp.]
MLINLHTGWLGVDDEWDVRGSDLREYESYEGDLNAPKDNDHWISFAFVNPAGIEQVLPKLSPATARKKEQQFQYNTIEDEKLVAAVRRLCDDYKKKVDNHELNLFISKSVYSIGDYTTSQAVCIVDQVHKSNHKACEALTDEDINSAKQMQQQLSKGQEKLNEGYVQLAEEQRQLIEDRNRLERRQADLSKRLKNLDEQQDNQKSNDRGMTAIATITAGTALLLSFLLGIMYLKQRSLINMYDTYLSPMYRKYTEPTAETDYLTLETKLQRLSKDHQKLWLFLVNQKFNPGDTYEIVIEVLTNKLNEYQVLQQVTEAAKELLKVKKQTSNHDFLLELKQVINLEKNELTVLVKLASSLKNRLSIDKLGKLTHTKASDTIGLIELFEAAPLKVSNPLVLDISQVTDNNEIEVIQDVFRFLLNITTALSESESPAAVPSATSHDRTNATFVQIFKQHAQLSPSIPSEELAAELYSFFDERKTLTMIVGDLRTLLNSTLKNGFEASDAEITSTIQNLLVRHKSNDDNSKLESALHELSRQKLEAEELISQFRQQLELEPTVEYSKYTAILDEKLNELKQLKNKQDEFVKVLKLDKDLQKLAQVKGQGTIDKIRLLIEQKQQGDQSTKILMAIGDWLCTVDKDLAALDYKDIPQIIEQNHRKMQQNSEGNSVFEDKSKALAKRFVDAQTALNNALKQTNELEKGRRDALDDAITQMSCKHDLSKPHDIEKWQRGISSLSVYVVVGNPVLCVLVELERPMVEFYYATVNWLAYQGIQLDIPLYSAPDESNQVDDFSIDNIPGYLQVAEQRQRPLVNHLLKQTALNLVYLHKLAVAPKVLEQLAKVQELPDYDALVNNQDIEVAPLVTLVTAIGLIKDNRHYGDTFVEQI